MGKLESRYVDYFYGKYKGRVAISVGYAENMQEVYPFVLENKNGRALGIIALAVLPNAHESSVHIYHLGAFNQRRGHGSNILTTLCRKADQDQIVLSVSPIPSPNGKPNQINTLQLTQFYHNHGFNGDGLLFRHPQ